MRKWRKAISGLFIAGLAFVMAGNVNVYADKAADDEIVRIVSATYDGKAVYYDDEIDIDDFKVKVRYGDGTQKYLSSSDFSISPSRMESTSYERVTVTVDGLDTTVKVKSAGAILESIKAYYDGDDLVVGGQVDRSDVEVTAYYNDGSDKEVDGWEFDNNDYRRLEEGDNDILIVYKEGDYEAEDEITVYAYEGEIERISATYNGAAVVVGGTVSKSNIVVNAVYDTGRGNSSQRLYDFYLRSYSIKEGNNTITVYYNEGGKTYEDTITVKGVLSTGTTTAASSTIATGNGTWEAANGRWRYKENGVYMANRWVQSAASGLWYWMEADGTMAANTWHNDNGTWYWLKADGSMATGWVFVGGQWYYMDDINGDMRVGWKWDKGICYYLDPAAGGAMATSRWIGNYYVDGTGAWTMTR